MTALDKPVARRAPTDWLQRLYWVVGSLGLLALCVVTPPFQVPDEPQHFYRSYQLSRMEVLPVIRDGKAGAELPSSIPALVKHHLGTLDHHLRRQIPERALSETLQGLHGRLDATREQFVEFTGSAMYAPLPYVPQAIAIAAGRTADISPLGLLFAARAANALTALVLIGWAVSRLCAARATGIALALLPMSMFMLASASPDALTIAGGFLVAALVARFATNGIWERQDSVAWVLGGLLLSTVKVVYFPLMFAGLAAVLGSGEMRDVQRWRGIRSQALGAMFVLVLTALWFWWRPSGVTNSGTPPGVDAAAQLAHLRESPLLLLQTMPRTFFVQAGYLIKSTLGLLGWLTVVIPWSVLGIIFAALPVGVLLRGGIASRSPSRPWGCVWVLALAFVVLDLIVLAHYVAWTPVGNYEAHGVQGRYLLPVLPMLAVALSWCVRPSLTPRSHRTLRLMFIALCIVMPLITLITLKLAYSL